MKWWSTRIARWSGGRRRNPRSSWSRSPSREQLIPGGRTVIERQHPKVRRPSTLTRRLGDADVDQQALEPRIESFRIAEALQVTPGDHQRILEGILGPIDVAREPLGDREQPVGANADQVDVRVPITVP